MKYFYENQIIIKFFKAKILYFIKLTLSILKINSLVFIKL